MEEVIKSSGNVFADLGFPNAEELQLQAKLVYELQRILEQKGWTAQHVAKVLGWPLATASALLAGDFIELSVGELLAALARLNQKVEVHVFSTGKESFRQRVVPTRQSSIYPTKEAAVKARRGMNTAKGAVSVTGKVRAPRAAKARKAK